MRSASIPEDIICVSIFFNYSPQLVFTNSRIQYLRDHLSEEPEVSITYFQADERKAGGSYIVFTGTVKKIDEYSKSLLLSNGKAILFEDICSIEAPCFVEEIV